VRANFVVEGSRRGVVLVGVRTWALSMVICVALCVVPGPTVEAASMVALPATPPTTEPAADPDPDGVSPDDTVPDGTVPDTTVPDGTAPDDTMPGDTVPGEPPTTPVPTVPDDEVVEPPGPGLPTGPPPGFTEEQFRSFLDVVQACGFDAGRVCEQVLAWTGNATLAEASQWVYDVPFRIVLILVAALLVNLAVRRSVDRYAQRLRARTAADPDADATSVRRDSLRVTTAAGTIGRAATLLIFTIAGLIALGEFGITLGPLLAGAGIAGIALGFGAQNLVRDMLAGLFVVFEDQYGVGDIIDAGRASGTVEEVTLRITKIRDVHGTLWFVPNGTIQEVGNKTQLWARAVIDFDIDYRADHEEAGRIIKDTADRLWREHRPGARILEEPELWGVESLGDSAVVIRLAVKCAPAEQWKLARVLRGEVKKSLDAAGIEIPFPQHTIWVHADPDVPRGKQGPAGGRDESPEGAVPR
jgi:moderate conductance mechanosensitive channel